MEILISNNKYNEVKQIISGCNTIQDAYFFINMYLRKNPEMRNIAVSMVNGKNYGKYVDFETMKNVTSDLNHCEFQEDALEITVKNFKSEINQLQMKTFSRITKSKPNRPTKKDVSYYNKTNSILTPEPILVTKKCPHCSHECTASENTSYIICGYQNSRSGFDMDGCGCDWCFRCGKKLCKQWYMNTLYLDINRIHNDECCKQHALEHKFVYPDDYCQCIKR